MSIPPLVLPMDMGPTDDGSSSSIFSSSSSEEVGEGVFDGLGFGAGHGFGGRDTVLDGPVVLEVGRIGGHGRIGWRT